ncbi:hypothetical protein [Streptomyces sp. NPDC047042]|uniref:hypothetical protein n=1 Tax=Streptomyces sp. NPDC047042 TaxID=3154807 RepID=UPI0033D33708
MKTLVILTGVHEDLMFRTLTTPAGRSGSSMSRRAARGPSPWCTRFEPSWADDDKDGLIVAVFRH